MAVGISLLLGLLVLPAWASWLATVGLVTIMGVLAVLAVHQSRRIAGERRSDSICSFARAFERRQVDPWVVRAVYEAYSVSFPVRADDVLDQELVDFDAADIAERAGRCLERVEENPLFGRVSTAGDLVRFLSLQPRLAGHPASGEAKPDAAADGASSGRSVS